MSRKVTVLAIGLCGMLWQSAQAQGLPQYPDLIKTTLQLRKEVADAKEKVFSAITTSDYPKLLESCKEMMQKDDAYMKSFYSNKSYYYFLANKPKNFKEQYLANSIESLVDAMGNRMQAIGLVCNTPAIERHVLMSALSLLSSSYTATHNAELWVEMADIQK